MDIFLAILLFAVGAFVVAKGADLFVDASSWVSDVTGISKVLIGATIVAVATSGPELFVSLFASLQGQTDMSTGNVIGSHLCNLGIGFALIAIFKPGKNSDKLYIPSSLITLLTAVLLLGFYLLGTITYIHALILLVVYAFFAFISIRFSDSGESLMQACPANNQDSTSTLDQPSASTLDQPSSENLLKDEGAGEAVIAVKTQGNQQTQSVSKRIKKPTNKKEVIINILKFSLGLTGIILGSKLIVDNATVLAKAMGISEMIIGLTIVAIGTSLPEIVTTIAALIKKESDLGIGNIFGSCVFNNAVIIPVSAFIVGSLTFSKSVLIDLPVAIMMTLITILPTAIGKKIYRLQGVACVAIYAAYIIYLVIANT